MNRVRTVLGTMGVGGPLDVHKTKEVLEIFKKRGHYEIDTALMYQGGKTETTLAKAGLSGFKVATKANPWFDINKNITTNDPSQGLRPETLKTQVNLSLKSLETKKVDLLYLHAPDHSTPLLDTLKAINEMHQQDLFDEWGLSNYASWEVVFIYHLCNDNNWKPPSVYQGMYNCLTRVVEQVLIPVLRLCKMRFYAYNPLAGGILTDRYTYDADPDSGRFTNKTVWGVKYRERFWKKETFAAIDQIKQACAPHGISLLEGTLSWLYNHSQLKAELGDGVIIGGSSVQQISDNLNVVDNIKTLPPDVVQAIEEAWKITEPVCQKYFR